jgi:hypothetical protein
LYRRFPVKSLGGHVARTGVVELEADVLERLESYLAEFAGGFGYITRTRWAGIYFQGLFLDGDRKSIKPLSRRVSVPGWRGDTEQAPQQFVNQSAWAEQTYRRVLVGALTIPKALSSLTTPVLPREAATRWV